MLRNVLFDKGVFVILEEPEFEDCKSLEMKGSPRALERQ
jgi:hypothetical protein